MADYPRDKGSTLGGNEAESTERWVSGKSQDELLSDLKVYSARLRDDPHSIQDRLRVAAIQLRLGRIEEALVHYEGVLRGYVAQNQILSAIALCRRILGIYPDLDRLKRILAALYARVPHESAEAPMPVTPIDPDQQSGAFVLHDAEDADTSEDVVADRLFHRPPASLHGVKTASRDLLAGDDLKPTLRYDAASRGIADIPTETGEAAAQPIPLTNKKRSEVEEVDEEEAETGHVVLLTKKKR